MHSRVIDSLLKMRYNTHIDTKEQEMTVKEQLFEKLAEDDDAFKEVRSYLTRLEEAVDYYVD